MSSVAARARRRPWCPSTAGAWPPDSSQAFSSVPGGRTRREACRTTSWLESTQVAEAGGARAGGGGGGEECVDALPRLAGIPGGREVLEVEGLAGFARAGVQRRARTRDPGLGDGH